MNEEMVLNIGSEALKTIIYIAGPLLASAMIVGLIVSIFQAITQINESTLTFIPKMVAVVCVLSVMSPWMIEVLQTYATGIFGNFNDLIK
jgi:flagellar biosynthetic protein FliQ